MKKLLIWGAILTAIFSLTDCTEEIFIPSGEAEEVSYTIFANPAGTKTVNSGFSTLWAEDDSLSVFHAPAGTDKYSGYSRFDLVDGTKGEFATRNLVGDLAGSNDWYVFYPYSKYLVTPASTSKGYLPVGSKHDGVQTQTGNNSMAHIAGENYPMWGVARNVSGEEFPGVTMTHITSLVEVVVTNNSGVGLTVNSVSLTGTEPVIGTYYFDFTGEEPVLTSSGDIYVSNVATLSVVGGETIPVSGTAKFYLAVKPFTAHAGQTLKLSVNGVEKEMNLAADVTFEPGKVKTLNYSYNENVLKPEPDWASKEFWHRSVAFRFTADWCGMCPMMATALKNAQDKLQDKLEAVSVHCDGALTFSDAYYLQQQFGGIYAYPTGILDERRLIENEFDISKTTSKFVAAVEETEQNYPTRSGIGFESSLNGRSLTLNATIYLKKAGTYKVTALLVEDNYVGYQEGQSDYYFHDGVARVALSDILGDEISTTYDNQEVAKTYTCNIPSGYDIENMRVVIYTHAQYGSQKILRTADYGDYYIDNSATGKVGTDVDVRFVGDAPDKDDRFDEAFLRFLLTADNITYNGSPDGKVDADGDGWLSNEELSKVTGLNMNGSGVESLKGIELMRYMEYFKYEGGLLKSLNLSRNTELDFIYCKNNSISDVVLPAGFLRELDLSNNKLTSLDLTKNTYIIYLDCSGNQLTELDLSTNTGLEHLNCTDNRISELDICALATFYTSGGVLYVGNQKNGATLTLSVSQQQEAIWNQYWDSAAQNANVRLSVAGRPNVKKPNIVIYSHEAEVYCDGIYEYGVDHGFSCNLGWDIDRTFFSISFDYYAEPDTAYDDMPILVLSNSYRVLEVSVSQREGLKVRINSTSEFNVSSEVKAGEWNHVEVVYNNGDMLADDDYFMVADLNVNGDNNLSSINYGSGRAFKGKLRNIVVKSGYESTGPGGNIDDIPVEEW